MSWVLLSLCNSKYLKWYKEKQTKARRSNQEKVADYRYVNSYSNISVHILSFCLRKIRFMNGSILQHFASIHKLHVRWQTWMWSGRQHHLQNHGRNSDCELSHDYTIIPHIEDTKNSTSLLLAMISKVK